MWGVDFILVSGIPDLGVLLVSALPFRSWLDAPILLLALEGNSHAWQFAIMIKTQVQIPDELYKKAKALAKAKEWSLAEVFRRGLEYMTSVNDPAAMNQDW